MKEQQLFGIKELEQKIVQIDRALIKTNRVSHTIGTPQFGRPELDISLSSQLEDEQYLDAAIKVGKVVQALTENAIPRLIDLKAQTQTQIDLQVREQNAPKLAEITALAQLGYLPDYALKRSQEIQPEAARRIQENDDRQAQQTLDELSLVTVESSFNQHAIELKKLKELGFTSAFVIASKAGISLYTENAHLLATEVLQKAGVPIRSYEWMTQSRRKKYRASILFARDEARAIDAFRKDQNMIRFLHHPVRLICGKYNGDYPTSSGVQGSREYDSPKEIFRELGIRVGGKKKYSDFFTPDCPVPVFKYTNSYAYPVEYKETLKTFIAERARELGLAGKT